MLSYFKQRTFLTHHELLLHRLLNQQMAIVKVTEADLTSSSIASAAAATALPPAAAGSGRASSRLSGLAGIFSSRTAASNTAAFALSSSSPGGPASAALRHMRATVHALRSRSNTNSASITAAGPWLQLPQGAAAAAAVSGVGLVIDGAALAVALQPQHEDDLLALCKECSAVICCRVSPMQKAQVRAVDVSGFLDVVQS
jgi:hypothetical protein